MTSISSPNVLWDTTRDEPYILLTSPRLPSGLEVRLTPIRADDGEALVYLNNQEDIGARSYSTPYPYSLADSATSIAQWSEHLSTSFYLLRSSEPQPVLEENIFHALRLVPFSPSDASSSIQERLIATIGIRPHTSKSGGRIRDVGYGLLSEFAGLGIVGAAVDALTTFWEAWAKEDVHTWGAYVETNNYGSLKLLKRLGYEVKEVTMDPWPKEKGGGARESARMERGRFDGKVMQTKEAEE